MKTKNLKHITHRILFLLCAILLLTGFTATSASAAAPKLNKTKVTLDVKKTYTLKLNNNKKKVTWSSSNKSIATVNKKGVITARKKGSCTITAKAGKKKYKCKVTVKQPVTKLTLNTKSITLKRKNATATIKASISPKNANNKTVTWTSSNKNVATVNKKGKVRAKGAGTCTITATIDKKSTSVKVTVDIAHTHKWEPKYKTTTTQGRTEYWWLATNGNVYKTTEDIFNRKPYLTGVGYNDKLKKAAIYDPRICKENKYGECEPIIATMQCSVNEHDRFTPEGLAAVQKDADSGKLLETASCNKCNKLINMCIQHSWENHCITSHNGQNVGFTDAEQLVRITVPIPAKETKVIVGYTCKCGATK